MSSTFQALEYHNPLTRNCGACGAFGDWRHNLEPSVYKKKMLEVRNSEEPNAQTSILGPYTCKKCEGKTKATMRDEARRTRDREAAIEKQVRENAPTAGGSAPQAAPAFGTHLDAFRATTKSDHARETERLMEEADVTLIRDKDDTDGTPMRAGLEGFEPQSFPLYRVPDWLLSGGASAAQAPAPNRSNKKRRLD